MVQEVRHKLNRVTGEEKLEERRVEESRGEKSRGEKSRGGENRGEEKQNNFGKRLIVGLGVAS